MRTSLSFVLLVFGLAAVSLRSVHGALTEEDRTKIYAAILPFVAECMKEHGVTEDAIKKAKTSDQFGNFDPCFMACVLKKAKMIDEKGFFDTDAAAKLVQKFNSQEEDQTEIDETLEKCKSVNHVKVSDGAKGCERAKLINDCSLGKFLKSRH